MKRKIIFHDAWKWHEFQISVSINNVFLEHSHMYSFAYCPCLLLCSNGRLSSCDRDTVGCYHYFTMWLGMPQITVTRLSLDRVSSVSCVTVPMIFYFFITIMSKQKRKVNVTVILLRHSGVWIILIKLNGKTLYNDIIAVLKEYMLTIPEVLITRFPTYRKATVRKK